MIEIKSFTRRDKKGKRFRIKTHRRNKKLLGAGKNGRVYDLGRHVVKERTIAGQAKSEFRGLLGVQESKTQRKAAKIGVAPKIRKAEKRDRIIEMDKVRGETLSKTLPKLNERGQRSIGVKTGKTYKKLHNIGVIHNDSHLENVYRTKNKKIVIIDYGLSRDKKRKLTPKERLVDYKKLKNRSKDFPVFIEGYKKGYGGF